MTKIQLKYIAKWVELLRSGLIKQKQTQGHIRNNEGCSGAVMIAAVCMTEGNTLEEIQDIPNDLIAQNEKNWLDLMWTLKGTVVNNFIAYENAWSFNKMADYLTQKYL